MQDTNIPQNRVIIIGGDHHNGLGLARIFGLNGKKITAIIISCKKHSWIATSKYIENYRIFNNEKEAFDYICETYSNERLKPVLIPYSDGAALELDLRLNELKEKFFVPSINEKQGLIASLMNKENQYKWASERGVKMAKSCVVDLKNQEHSLPNTFGFPVILKPVKSAYAKKLDIAVCLSDKEYSNSIADLIEKKYESIFIQQFLNVDFEIVIVGAVSSKDDFVFSAYRVIRSWPSKGGTNSYSITITNEKILMQCKNLLKKIALFGYVGTIDVEAFLIKDELYLNEINWRNSGGDFRLLNHNYFYAYWFYLCICNGCVMSVDWHAPEKTYAMVEYTDFRHVLKFEISLIQWILDLVRCKNFALWNKNDMKPFFAKFLFALMR